MSNRPQDDVDAPDGQHQELVPQDDAIIGVAFKWSLLVIAIIVIGVVVGFALTRGGEEAPVVIDRGPIGGPGELVQDAPDMPEVTFAEIASGSGIEFVHTNGARGEKLLPETMGSGAAFFDFDNDGDEDLLLINAQDWPHSPRSDRVSTPVLYENDGAGAFTDVTAGSGLDAGLYGTGVACGDIDNDGLVDVFLAAVGLNRLYRNVGSGRFEDVTERAVIAGGAEDWSTSAGFLDYDGDGDLDLFVCNYVKWSREIDLKLNFTLNGTDRAYGPPTQYEGSFSALYRNDGSDGQVRFEDVSASSGIQVANTATGRPMGKALAVPRFVDIESDGDLDILVANDTVQNFAFRNNGDGTFEDLGSSSGIAFDSMGSATGAMGMDAADFGNQGRLGVGIANFANESTSFYVQQRQPWEFADMAGTEGIGSPSRLKLSFGLYFFDYDLDGRLDLLQANGHLEDEINEIQPSQHYEQPAQLFWNCGAEARSCYAAVPEDAVGDLAAPIVGRGASYADIDGDGDLDVLLTQSGGRPKLLRNDQSLGHHWVSLKLVGNGATSNRDAIGARIELTAAGVVQRRQVMPTRSYLSQVALPVTIGLGPADAVESLRITWPDGSTQSIDGVAIDGMIVIRQPIS